MYRVIYDGMFVTTEFEGTEEECKAFINEYNEKYDFRLLMGKAN